MATAKKKTTKKAANTATTSATIISDHGAGRYVWWDLSGSTDRQTLNTALDAAGLDHSTFAKNMTQPALALKNVMVRRASGMRAMCRPLQKRGAFAIVSEDVAVDVDVKTDAADARANGNEDDRIGEDLTYQNGVKAWIDRQDGNPVLRVTGADSAEAQSIRDDFEAERNALPANAFGVWCKRIIENHCAGVRVKRSGGIYFVPESHVATLESLVTAVQTANSGHAFHRAPCAPSDEIIATVLKGVTLETTEAIESIETALDKGDLGTRALNSKVRDIAGLADKLKAYDALLGSSLDSIRQSLTDCEANLGDAILQAEQAKEAEKLLKAAS